MNGADYERHTSLMHQAYTPITLCLLRFSTYYVYLHLSSTINYNSGQLPQRWCAHLNTCISRYRVIPCMAFCTRPTCIFKSVCYDRLSRTSTIHCSTRQANHGFPLEREKSHLCITTRKPDTPTPAKLCFLFMVHIIHTHLNFLMQTLPGSPRLTSRKRLILLSYP